MSKLSINETTDNFVSCFSTFAQRMVKLISLLILVILSWGCKKDWLDKKPDLSLTIPNTLEDYRSLMSGTTSGGAFISNYGTLVEHGAGDFYVSDVVYDKGPQLDKSFYSWASDLWSDLNYSEWVYPYRSIVYTNVVIEGLGKINAKNVSDQNDWNEIMGMALFYRGVWHYDIAKQFCGTYNKPTASTDLGIPLRLTTDFEQKSKRSTIEETYSQIIKDIKSAADLLPLAAPIVDQDKMKPTKVAAYAMLARIYLSMNDFESAILFADKALQLYSSLMNYSTKDSTSFAPFAQLNEEVILQMLGSSYTFLLNGSGNTFVDSVLYNSYNDNDLRKKLFFFPFSGGHIFKTSYTGVANKFFLGLASDELYLIRAECNARANNVVEALNDLNTLLRARWRDDGSFVPITAVSPEDALVKILTERRKELCLRGLRWTDLKRLNNEKKFEITLTRSIKGVTKSLAPNSPLYIFSIPPNVIELSGMQQNIR